MNTNNQKANVLAVCTSSLTGTKKTNVMHGILVENHGLFGDAHAQNKTHRQLSLLAIGSNKK